MYTNLVLSGGGVRGLVFVGCIDVLEKQNYFPFIKNFVGASVGSIFALFLACKYSSTEIKTFIKTHSANPKYTQLKIKNILNVYATCGLDDGQGLTEISKLILTQKGYDSETTFLELGKKSGKNLIITGSNITKHTIEYFNIDNTPDMPVHIAIRISTCIPMMFVPVLYKECYYLDSCVYNNFPIEYFKREPTTTCGIFLKNDEYQNTSATNRSFTNIIELFGALAYSIMSHVEHLQIDYDLFKHRKQLYEIIVKPISVVRWKDMRLNIDESIFNELYKVGKEQMLEHIKQP